MSYFTTHLSFILLMKEFLRLVEVTGKIVDCVIYHSLIALLSSKMQISPDKLNNLCMQTETVIQRCCVNRQIKVS